VRPPSDWNFSNKKPAADFSARALSVLAMMLLYPDLPDVSNLSLFIRITSGNERNSDPVAAVSGKRMRPSRPVKFISGRSIN
jgi:hypothetical protein